MCLDPASLAALALAGGGAVVQNNAQQSAIKRQQDTSEAALLEQDASRQKNANLQMQTAQQYNGTDREQAVVQAQTAAGDKLASAVTSQQLPALTEAGANGTVSKEFTALSGQRLLDNMKKATTQAQLMGKLRGFNDQKLVEGQNNANSAVAQGLNSTIAKSQWEAAQPRIAQAGQPSSGQMLLGSLLQAGSMAAAPASMKLFPRVPSPASLGDFSGMYTASGLMG